MKLDSAETAVLVCHLQNDIIENQQALGALLAAEATRRNVVGAANRLLEAADSGAALPVLVASPGVLTAQICWSTFPLPRVLPR